MTTDKRKWTLPDAEEIFWFIIIVALALRCGKDILLG
jgi:hypothetical protein